MSTYPPDLEAFVQQKIAAGAFNSREELEIEAVRFYCEVEKRRAQLKSDVQAAIDEANRGLSKPFDVQAIKAQMRAKLDEQGRLK